MEAKFAHQNQADSSIVFRAGTGAVQHQSYNFFITSIEFLLQSKVAETCQIFNTRFIGALIARHSKYFGITEYDQATKSRINAVSFKSTFARLQRDGFGLARDGAVSVISILTDRASSRASPLPQGIFGGHKFVRRVTCGSGLAREGRDSVYSGITAITSISINHCGCPNADTTNPVEIGNTPFSQLPTS